MKKLASLAVTLALMAGAAMSEEIASGEWQLLALDGTRVSAETSFAIDAEGKVTGKAACNRYFGANQAALPALSFGAMGATRMFCDKQPEEDAYLKALGMVTTAELREDHLVMTGPEGSTLEFVRDPGDKGLVCLTCK